MRNLCATIVIVTPLLIAGCASQTALQSVTLQCQDTEGGCFGFYSFTAGTLPTSREHAEQADLVYYFDGDDCFQGALIGQDDRPGYLFPIGRKPWRELATLESPTNGQESVPAIMPLNRDKEGSAFWVKTKGGEYVLAKIKAVKPTTHDDLIAGGIATLELEWARP